jgi:hypothetical protein
VEKPSVSTRTHRRLLAVALSVVAITLAACGSSTETTPSPSAVTESVAASVAPPSASSSDPSTAPSAAASAAGGEGEQTSVFDLEVGDCFSASGQQVEFVGVVDCERSHVYEVFAVFDHEAGDADSYPGDQEIQDYADAACQPEFETFVGTDYESSRWYITSVTPSEQTWADGDREIVCTLNLEDRSEVTGTAEGAGD